MRNWPTHRYPLKKRLRIAASRKLIDFACALPSVQRGPLARLQSFGKMKALREHDHTACPDGVTLTPFNVTYFDLCFVEDFHKLRKGLKAMRRDMKPRAGAMDTTLDLDEWFGQTNQRVGGWFTRHLGNFDFTTLKDAPALISDAFVHISHFLPSAICTQVCVSPTGEFKERFQRLISTNARHRPTIHRFLRARRGWSISWPATHLIRQEQIEDLFLELNMQIVRVLRQYLRCGWLPLGALPSTEAFVLEKGDRADATPAHRRFWYSVDLPQAPSLSYTQTEFTIFPPLNALRRRLVEPHRILVNKPLMAKNGTLEQLGHEWNTIHARLEDVTHALCPLLAIQKHISDTAKEVATMRNRLSSVLSRPRWFFPRAFVARYGFRRMARLNNLVFLHRRLEAEVKADDLKVFGGTGLTGFKREALGKTDTGELIENMIWRVEMVTKHIGAQVGVLKDSYREVVSLRIQRILYIIAFVGVALAIIQFIPEATRISAAAYIVDAVKGCLGLGGSD